MVLARLLHPGEWDRFSVLCVETSPTELIDARGRVQRHVGKIESAGGETQPADVETARRIGTALDTALTTANRLDADQRALLRGAVEYFVLATDEQDDLGDLLGFDDDARIANGVLRAIGRDDLVIEVAE